MKALLILITLFLVACSKDNDSGGEIINAENLSLVCTQNTFTGRWVIDEIISEHIWLRSEYATEKHCILPINLIRQYEIYVVQE